TWFHSLRSTYCFASMRCSAWATPAGFTEYDATSRRQVLGKIEATVDGRVEETGHCRDPVAAQCHHVECAEMEAAVVPTLVVRDRDLTARRQRPQEPLVVRRVRGDEADDVVASVEPGRQRGHRETGIFGEQLDQGVDVGVDPGIHEPLDENALARFTER